MIWLILPVLLFPLILFLYFTRKKNPSYSHLPEMTLYELSKYDGSSGKVYVGASGLVFDVSSCEAYHPGNNYSVFSGKDATVALAKMSLKPEDMNIEAELDEIQKKTLKEWVEFYKTKKNYPIVARLSKKPKLN